jgi:predicted phage tail component-like protein
LPTQLDNYTFADFGLIEEFGHVHPSTPEFSDKTISIPGRPGLLSFGTETGAVQFTFPLKVFVRDRFERQRRKNNFVAFLFDAYRQPRTFKLTLDYEPDKYYLAKVGGQITPEMLAVMDQFELTVVANDPTKYSVSKSEEITWENDEILISSDISWMTGDGVHSVTTPSTIEVINNGNLAQTASFTISGTGANVGFSCNGKSFNLGTFTNTTFEIDGKTYSVKKNGVDSFSALTGKFIELLPGINKVQITGSNLNLTISENLRYAYM